MKRLRENIDQVDSVLVKLLNQRAQWALEIGEVKKGADLPIYQPDREKAVLARVQELNRGPLGQAAVQRLFERIIDESRRLERIGGEGEGPGSGAADAGASGRQEGRRRMIVVMRPGADDPLIERVIARLISAGCDIHRSTGSERTILGAIGVTAEMDLSDFEVLPGVERVLRVSTPYKLVSRRFRPGRQPHRARPRCRDRRRGSGGHGRPRPGRVRGPDPPHRARGGGAPARKCCAPPPSRRARAPTPSRAPASRGSPGCATPPRSSGCWW